MASDVTKVVLNAKDARLFISKVDVSIDPSLSKDIYNSDNDDSFFYISKEIGSRIKIVDVKIISDNMLSDLLV